MHAGRAMEARLAGGRPVQARGERDAQIRHAAAVPAVGRRVGLVGEAGERVDALVRRPGQPARAGGRRRGRRGPPQRRVAAVGRGPVERLVGAFHERRGVGRGREVADADRRRQREPVRERAGAHGGTDPLGRREGLRRRRVGQQPGELLAPDAPDRVDRARLGGDALRGLGEDAVADGMAVLVVDGLEVVEVDDDEPERPAAGGQALGLLRQPRGERAVVEQAGEAVAVGLADELGLARGLGGPVMDRDELGDVAPGERARHDGDRCAPPPAVAAGESDLDRSAPGRGRPDPYGRRGRGR